MTSPRKTLSLGVKICRRCDKEYDESRPKCPSCAIRRSRAYYEKNKEELKAKQRERRKENIDEVREADRKRRDNEESREKKRIDYSLKKEKYRARNNKWKAVNPENKSYRAMVERCTDPRIKNWKDYGGRGIRVCDRWLGKNGYRNFLADVGPRPTTKHSIDRYPDNDGNYEPGNVRWATQEQQARNKRTTFWITFRGETKCLKEWSTELGVGYSTLFARIRVHGWSIERAFTEGVATWETSTSFQSRSFLKWTPSLTHIIRNLQTQSTPSLGTTDK